LLLAAACDGPTQRYEPLEVGPLEVFAAEVQPHIESRCASAGCHGAVGRPLSLYARGQYRAEPERTFYDEQLTRRELEANAERVAAFAHGSTVEACLFLQKPLAQEAGGVYHGGGDVFVDADDPAYRAIALWLARRSPLSSWTEASGDGGAP